MMTDLLLLTVFTLYSLESEAQKVSDRGHLANFQANTIKKKIPYWAYLFRKLSLNLIYFTSLYLRNAWPIVPKGSPRKVATVRSP